MVFALVFSGIGLFVYGYMVQTQASPEICAVFHGVMLFGILIGAITTSGYALDAYRELSNEIFIMAMVFKNFLFYGMSYFVNNWVAEKGPEQMFNVLGGISIAVVCLDISQLIQCFMALPVYIFGKRLRSFWARHVLLCLRFADFRICWSCGI
jgi:hypothetical protein